LACEAIGQRVAHPRTPDHDFFARFDWLDRGRSRLKSNGGQGE
jgi:hypothetical protein